TRALGSPAAKTPAPATPIAELYIENKSSGSARISSTSMSGSVGRRAGVREAEAKARESPGPIQGRRKARPIHVSRQKPRRSAAQQRVSRWVARDIIRVLPQGA